MIKEFIKKCFELKGVRILFWIALLFFTIDCLGIIFASIDAVFWRSIAVTISRIRFLSF